MFEAYLPTMIKKNKGHIVALSSMAGIGGFPNLVPYCGSKFAVRGLMEALHEELREDPRQLKVCNYLLRPKSKMNQSIINPWLTFKLLVENTLQVRQCLCHFVIWYNTQFSIKVL